jgi:ABC-2 type transport system permease protein
MVVLVLFQCVTDPIGTVFMFHRFGGIGVWTLERIILIYALAVASFGLAESLCRGFDYFPWHILRTGGFDRLLLRPNSLFVQVAASFFHIHRLSRPAAGLAVALWALNRLGVPFTLYNAAMLAAALLGGLLMYAGVFMLSSGIAFFTIKALDWIYILTNASYQVSRIPRDHMPAMFKNAFTFFLPVLVVSYYPASAVCGWGDPSWLGWLALPAGTVFLAASSLVWRIGVRHYKSTGS